MTSIWITLGFLLLLSGLLIWAGYRGGKASAAEERAREQANVAAKHRKEAEIFSKPTDSDWKSIVDKL